MFICRLVEEVKDACSVTLEADDIYMNTRYCFHWRFLYKLLFLFFFLDTGISVPQNACPGENAVLFVVFDFRYEDFVRLAVLHSRGGGHQEFTCNTVSTLKTKTLALKVKNYAHTDSEVKFACGECYSMPI